MLSLHLFSHLPGLRGNNPSFQRGFFASFKQIFWFSISLMPQCQKAPDQCNSRHMSMQQSSYDKAHPHPQTSLFTSLSSTSTPFTSVWLLGKGRRSQSLQRTATASSLLLWQRASKETWLERRTWPFATSRCPALTSTWGTSSLCWRKKVSPCLGMSSVESYLLSFSVPEVYLKMFENKEQSEEEEVAMAWQEEQKAEQSALQREEAQTVDDDDDNEDGESEEDEESSATRSSTFVSSSVFFSALVYLIFCWPLTLLWSKENVISCINIFEYTIGGI